MQSLVKFICRIGIENDPAAHRKDDASVADGGRADGDVELEAAVVGDPLDDETTVGPQAKVELRDELITLLAAGHETTATALAFAFDLLTHNPEVLARLRDEHGYCEGCAREAITMLESMGISVEFSHHEGGPGQQEIDLRHTDALTMADSVMTFRLAVREIAARNGVHATFMPKPI